MFAQARRHAMAAEQRPMDEAIPMALSAGAPLINIDAATICRLFGETAVYLPVAVSDSPAGRRTVYKLPIGERVLMGVYVVGMRLYRDYYTRLSDTEYAVSKESPTGDVLFAGKGTLKILDERVGAGEITFEEEGGKGEAAARPTKCTCTRRWYVWSFIGTEDCSCTGGRPPIITS
jgi:hypothetical protein